MISSGFLLPFISFFVVIIIHNPWLMGIPFLTNQFAMAWRCRSSTLLNGMSPVRLSWYHGELHLHKFGEFTVYAYKCGYTRSYNVIHIYIYPLISGTALPNIPSRLTGHLHGKPLDVHPKSEDDRSKSGADSMVITFSFLQDRFPGDWLLNVIGQKVEEDTTASSVLFEHMCDFQLGENQS